MSTSEELRHLTLEQSVGRMSDTQKQEYYARESKLDDQLSEKRKSANSEHEANISKHRESLTESMERGMYGNMSRQQLQEAHSEIDGWSKS